MNRFPVLLAILLVLLVSGSLVITSAAQEGTLQTAEADSLTLVTTINVGGEPDSIVVNCSGPNCGRRYDIAYIDKSTDKIHFIDGDTFQPTAEEISVPISSGFYNWMVYNRYHQLIYGLSDRKECNNDFGFDCWWEVFVIVIAGRESVGSFSVNEVFDNDPPSPSDTPLYGIAGFAIKQPYSEGGNNGRLFIHDYLNTTWTWWI